MEKSGYKSNGGYNLKPISITTKVPGATPSPDLDQADSNRKMGQGSGEHGGTVDTASYASVPNQVSGLPPVGNVTENPKLR